jgi:phage antirepressor YoqD-like protein
MSTTSLAKGLEIKVKDLFQTLFRNRLYIEKDNDNWNLADKEKRQGEL